MSAVALKHCEKYPMHIYRGVDLISDALPFGRLWYGERDAISNAVEYAKFYSRSDDAVIRVYNEAGTVIENARARGRIQRARKHVHHAEITSDVRDQRTKLSQSQTDRIRASSKVEDLLADMYAHQFWLSSAGS